MLLFGQEKTGMPGILFVSDKHVVYCSATKKPSRSLLMDADNLTELPTALDSIFCHD